MRDISEEMRNAASELGRQQTDQASARAARALEKLRELKRVAPPEVLLEVDGGVNSQTIGPCAAAGAQLHVVGSAIFSHNDFTQSVATLTRLAETASRTH